MEAGNRLAAAGFAPYSGLAQKGFVPTLGQPGAGGGALRWTVIDPWLKKSDLTHGHDVVGTYTFDKDAFYRQTSDQSAEEWLEEQLRGETKNFTDGCTKLGDFGRNKVIVPYTSNFLPAVLGGREVAALGEWTEVPEEFRHTVTYSLLGQWGETEYSYTARVAEVIHKPVRPAWTVTSQYEKNLIDQYGGLDKVPFYLLAPVPHLVVGDQTVAQASTGFVPGESMTFVVELAYPNFTPDRMEHFIYSGGEYVDVLLDRKVPEKILLDATIALKAARAAGVADAERRATAELLALTYYDLAFKNQDKIEKYLGMVFPSLTVDSFAFKNVTVVAGYFGEPVEISPGPWGVDIIRNFVPAATVTTSMKQAKLAWDLLLIDSSVFEHRAIQAAVNHEAVSAVKVMHLCAARGIQIFLVDETNWEDTKDLYLHQPEEFLAAIGDLINQGYSVYVPARPIQVGAWYGSAYIGGGSFIISGGFASGTPLAWNGGSGTGSSPSGGGPGRCSCPTCCANGGPSLVDLSSGNFTFGETDLSLSTPGIAVVLGRTYNSNRPADLGLGAGWGWTYGIRASEGENGDVTVIWEDGVPDLYKSDGQGGYVHPPGLYNTLAKTVMGYTLTSSTGTVRQFAPDGRLLSVNDPNGNIVGIRYASGLPNRVVDATDHTVLSFETAGVHVTKVTDMYGRSVTFTYAGDDLVGVKDAVDGTVAYTYDDAHRMISKTDRNGSTGYVYYDAAGRWSRATDMAGYMYSAEYDFVARVTKYTDADGNVETYGYDENGAKVLYIDGEGNKVEYVRDANMNVLEEIHTDRENVAPPLQHFMMNFSSPGDPPNTSTNKTVMTYDERGNLLSQTDPLGNVTTYTYDPVYSRVLTVTDAEGKTSTNTYSPTGNLLTSTDPGGNVTTYVYNGHGQPTEIQKPGGAVQTLVYDSTSGNISGMGDSYGNLTQIAYDGFGNLASFTDAAGHTRTMVSDAAGRILSMTDASGNTTSFTFDANGNRLTSTDAAGKTTNFSYDKKGRLLSATDALGNVTRTTYDGNGNVFSRTDAKGSVTSFVYNKSNQLVTTLDAYGNRTRQGYCADIGCPSCGGGGSSGVCSATDALGNTTVTHFDLLGRATETISPTGSVTTTAYDSLGRQAGTIDALGNETHYTYDSLGRLWKVTDALGGVTEYDFDVRGNRTSVKDAMGNETRFEYDLNNRLVKETNPLGIETTFAYNATGSRATRTGGNGFTTIYRYDSNRRLSEIEYPDGKKTQYMFDQKGNKTFEGYFDPALSFAATSRTFTYDDLGRLHSMTDSSLGKVILYEFDESGNRSAITDAEGNVTHWEYDRNNRPGRVTDADGSLTRYEYDAAGRRTKAIYGNGVWTEYLYDASSQLVHMVTRDRTNQILQGWHYVYDLRGNRTNKTDYTGNVESYLYDALGRLIQTTYPNNRIVKWTYDAVGNRLTQDDSGSITTYSYNAANQIEHSISPSGAYTQFLFDGNGNMVYKYEPSGVTQYTWDFENRLRQVSSPSGVTNFGYDANGIRVFKESFPSPSGGGQGEGVRTDYLIDTVSVLAEYEAGLKKATYTLGPRIDEIISQSNDQGKFWYMADALGSVTGLTDTAGRVVNTYRYGAWGEDNGVTRRDVRNPYRWTGREWDPTGLNYNRSRYYSQATSNWLSVDQLLNTLVNYRFPSTSLMMLFTNGYQYGESNPIRYSDPTGLFSFEGFDWLVSFLQFVIFSVLPILTSSAALVSGPFFYFTIMLVVLNAFCAAVKALNLAFWQQKLTQQMMTGGQTDADIAVQIFCFAVAGLSIIFGAARCTGIIGMGGYTLGELYALTYKAVMFVKTAFF